jgi:hypothetical protein
VGLSVALFGTLTVLYLQRKHATARVAPAQPPNPDHTHV